MALLRHEVKTFKGYALYDLFPKNLASRCMKEFMFLFVRGMGTRTHCALREYD